MIFKFVPPITNLSVIFFSVRKLHPLLPDIQIAALPLAVTSTFSSHIQGKYKNKFIPQADLSRVDDKLVEALLPFQRDGVKWVVIITMLAQHGSSGSKQTEAACKLLISEILNGKN